MKFPKKPSLELIEWDDASGPHSMSWRHVEEVPKLTRYKITSVGYVALEDEKLVRLVHNTHCGKKKKVRTISGYMDIPKSMITRRVKLMERET